MMDWTGEWSETTAAMAVLGALLVSAALLSYFVVAPEYEKRLDRELQQQFDLLRLRRRRSRPLGAWDMEAGSSDDDARACFLARTTGESESDASPASMAKVSPTAAWRGARRVIRMHSSIGPGTAAAAALRQARAAAASTPRSWPASDQRDESPGRLTRRRKSESDALKQSSVARTDMLRRRVLLRRLEEEIERSKQANDLQTRSDTVTADAELSQERLDALLAHPAECEQELAVLTAVHKQQGQRGGDEGDAADEAKRALRTVLDMLTLHLSLERRDVNKVTVFCNALLRHDGLTLLRALQASADADVRALATAVIEKAVPAIWH